MASRWSGVISVAVRVPTTATTTTHTKTIHTIEHELACFVRRVELMESGCRMDVSMAVEHVTGEDAKEREEHEEHGEHGEHGEHEGYGEHAGYAKEGKRGKKRGSARNGGGRSDSLKTWHSLYPINALRNVALRGAKTDWVFLLDIDFIPSAALHQTLKDIAPRAPLGGAFVVRDRVTV